MISRDTVERLKSVVALRNLQRGHAQQQLAEAHMVLNRATDEQAEANAQLTAHESSWRRTLNGRLDPTQLGLWAQAVRRAEGDLAQCAKATIQAEQAVSERSREVGRRLAAERAAEVVKARAERLRRRQREALTLAEIEDMVTRRFAP